MPESFDTSSNTLFDAAAVSSGAATAMTTTATTTVAHKLHRWTSVEDRASTARQAFDFDTLAFRRRPPDERRADRDASSTDTGSTYYHSNGRSSDECFSSHLSLQPSQQLLRETSASMRSTSGRRLVLPQVRNETFLDQLNFSGLKVEGRENELRTLQELYNSAVTATRRGSDSDSSHRRSNKMVLISGHSGAGKSALALELRKRISTKATDNSKTNSYARTSSNDDDDCPASINNCIWCAGKFDQHYSTSDPYDAIGGALENLMEQNHNNPELMDEWKERISMTLGEETDILIELVPSLSVLLDPTTPGRRRSETVPTSNVQDATASQRRQRRERTPVGGRIPIASNGNDRSITEKAIRIQNVLIEFIRLIATKDHPITLLLDDIQWASTSAIALIDALLVDRSIQHFFLLATCRQEYLVTSTDHSVDIKVSDQNEPTTNASKIDKTQQTHKGQEQEQPSPTLPRLRPLQQFIDRHSDKIHQIVIGGLDVARVQRIVNTLLRIDVDSNETNAFAAIVQHKCDGNPFFVLQFMRLLVDQQLLTYNWGTFSWTWLEGDIQSAQVATNVADAVQKRLQTLSGKDRWILQVASCVGASFEVTMLQFVFAGLQEKYQDEWDDIPEEDWPEIRGGDRDEAISQLHNRLDAMHETGILERQFVHLTFDFAHDQVQAAAFALIPDSRKIILQTAIGQRLIEGLDENNRDQFLFTAVQLWRLSVLTMSESEKTDFAFWSFVAGDTALKQGAFDAALDFLETSIQCLGDDPFEHDPDLALPLFSGAAEASYCLNDKRVMNFVDMVQRQPTIHKSDMIRVDIIKLKVLSSERDFVGCANEFSRICAELGAAKFSKKPGIPSVLYQVVKTTHLLKTYDREKIVQLPACNDPNIAGALKAENACFAQLYMSNLNLCVIATCQAVQWSLRHGHSKATPPALVMMAMMLIGITGGYEKACELGEAALELSNVYGYKETLPATVALVFGYVRHWRKPMHDFVAPMRYAMDLGMRIGNMDDCGLLFSTHGLMLLLCQIGTLPAAIQEIEEYRHIMIEHNINDHLVFTECNLQFAQKMAFEFDDCWSLNGDIMKEEAMFAKASENKDEILFAFLHYQKMMLNVYFDRPIDAAISAEINRDVGFKVCQGCHFVPRNTFFAGLSMILAHRLDRKGSRLKTAKLMKNRLKAWVKAGNPNVPHFLHLLRAELKYSSTTYKAALDAYREALKVSMRTGLKLDFALTNELLAAFFADHSNPAHDVSQSRYHLQTAMESYGEYGASNKVRHLRQKHTDILDLQQP